MREAYPDDDGMMCRECKGCAGEYAIRTDDALESSGLVGEGCPWESVQQMAVDLGEAVYSYRKALEAVPGPSPDASLDRVARIGAAAALLSSGSNP